MLLLGLPAKSDGLYCMEEELVVLARNGILLVAVDSVEQLFSKQDV
jgi:hypothetical protein